MGDVLLVALFGLFLLAPASLHLLSLGQTTAADEMRNLVVRPALPTSLGAWRNFGTELDAWLADRFGLRPALVAAASRLRFAFRLPGGKSVVAGKDGWLYSNFYGEIEQHTGLQLMSQAEVEGWIGALKQDRDWLAARGIRFVFVIVPDKSEIYPEHLPEGLPRGSLTIVDQMTAALRRDGTIDYVDLTPAMQAAKATGQIYYRTDNHWNRIGAYWGLAAVMKGRWPAGIGLPPLTDYSLDERPFHGPLVDYLKLQCCLGEPRGDLLRRFPDPVVAHGNLDVPDAGDAWIDTIHKDYPGVFLIADSFAWAWFQLLPDVSSRMLYSRHDGPFPATAIEKEKPAIVIYELVANYLMGPPQRAPLP